MSGALDMDSTPDVVVTEDDGLLFLEIARPHAKNAATLAASRIVADALDELDSRNDLRVAILTGAGDMFCAGMDLKKFLEGERPLIPGRGFLGLTIRPPKKPLVAAVEGYALGGGFEAALACDLIVAGEGARFGLPEVKRGLLAMAGGLMRLPRQIPERVAMELILTGNSLTAERAYELGLINMITSDGQALENATSIARQIAANAPLSLLAAKEIACNSRDWPSSEMFERQEGYRAPVFESEDAKEGARAFSEKRAPNWKGK